MDDSTKGAPQSPAPSETRYSSAQLLDLIRTLPEEQALRLLREHWSLLLPKEPSEVGLNGAYCRLLPHH